MTTVLEEVTEQKLDADHVRRRVDDWEERLNDLYATIESWLPNGWTAGKGPPVLMHAELMREFQVAPRQLPTLELASESGEPARLEPRGLWIVGANGRVDLKRDGHHYLIVDRAENFERPDWQAVRADRRRDRRKVSCEWLRQILQ